MGHTDHKEKAGTRPVRVHVVVVSTSRGPAEDRSGPVLEGALSAAGHEVAGKTILPDDGAAIVAELRRVQAEGKAQAVIFSGGTGISRRDGTFEAVRGELDKELPGFGEIFRMLSFQQIGSAAMLSRATAGVSKDVIVFAIPGSPNACKLAMEKLILPELAHLVWELGKETAPTAEAEKPRGVAVEAPAAAPAPVVEGAAAWERKLVEAGGALLDGRAAPPTDWPDAAKELLGRAGATRRARIGEEEYGIFGFPDLSSPDSRVLAVGAEGEVVALHRWPRKVGLCRPGGRVLPSSGRLARTSAELTGKEYPEEGRLFAVEPDAVWVNEGGAVLRWDGRRSTLEGPASTVVASLLLRWSQR